MSEAQYKTTTRTEQKHSQTQVLDSHLISSGRGQWRFVQKRTGYFQNLNRGPFGNT